MKVSIKGRSIPMEIMIFGLLLLILLFWYALSFTLHLISPPSEAMSREMEISSLDYGFSKILNHHVITIRQKGSDVATILAVDGRDLQIIDIDIEGKTRKWKTVDLDLSQASDIAADFVDSDTIRLLFFTSGLYQADINKSDGRYTLREIAEEISGFDMAGHYAVIYKGSALSLFNTADGSGFLVQPSSDIQSFKAGIAGNRLEILSISKKNWETVGIALHEIDPAGKTKTTFSIYDSASSKYFRELSDLRVSGNVLTALYKYRDRRYGVNRMTIQKIDLIQKRIISEVRCSVPLFNSSFTLIDSPPGTVKFIHQIDSINGINLSIATVDEEGVLAETPITKTKSMSKLAGYFTIGDYQGIVFSDINFDKRALLFASSQPRVMKDRSRLSTLPVWYPAGTTMLIFLVSIIGGGLFLLVEIPLPAAAAFLLDRFSKALHKPWYHVKTGLVAVIHTAVKLLLTRVLLASGQNFRFRPLLFGSAPEFYIILTAFTVICYILAIRMNRSQMMNPNGCMSFYFRFSFMDFLLYVPMVVMYLISSVLLSKI